jgi:glycosyltransferase involved in cell wall biosynthesis
MSAKPIDILVVGQTPPPYHGQAVMIKLFLEGPYKEIRLHHLRMAYSANIAEVGKFNSRKVIHLFELIYKTFRLRRQIGPCHLKYPPAGPNLIPILRDVVYLLSTRWLFRGTFFVYHAGGVAERVAKLPVPLRMLARRAYDKADVSVRLSLYSPDDAGAFQSRKTYVIPNALPDTAGKNYASLLERAPKTAGNRVRILFVANLNESKGTLVLLDALAMLLSEGYRVEADLVGEITDPTVRAGIEKRMENAALQANVRLRGVLVGEDKWKAYCEADLFVFPTFYESESFPLVLIEAMEFQLPVVSTKWRGVQSVVADGETGFLTRIQDPAATAEAISRLLRDPELAMRMGRAGRARYLAEYTIESFWTRIERAIVESAMQRRGDSKTGEPGEDRRHH